jgi:hypothetical protein
LTRIAARATDYLESEAGMLRPVTAAAFAIRTAPHYSSQHTAGASASTSIPQPERLQQIDTSNLKRHELAAAGQRFIGDAEHRPLAIGAKANTGAIDKLLDVFPA